MLRYRSDDILPLTALIVTLTLHLLVFFGPLSSCTQRFYLKHSALKILQVALRRSRLLLHANVLWLTQEDRHKISA